jgi:riboflavin kinase / FMN adenylyltransferase
MNKADKDLVLTIGNFDGVHQGHCHLLNQIKDKISSQDKIQVITFDPHPLEYLNSKQRYLLMDLDEKIRCLKGEGVDEVNVVCFDEKLRLLTAKEFLLRHILSQKNVRSLYLGYDFRFGKNKEGDFVYAKKECAKVLVDVIQTESFELLGDTVSSSRVRMLLQEGDCLKANELLGRTYNLNGRVVHGFGRGKTIGFPTTNITFSPRRVVPKIGVYVTSVLIDEKIYPSITNVGLNPTFSSSDDLKIESHHFGFEDDIYGHEIKIFFHERVRDEIKFNSGDELKEQILKDVKIALEKHEKVCVIR